MPSCYLISELHQTLFKVPEVIPNLFQTSPFSFVLQTEPSLIIVSLICLLFYFNPPMSSTRTFSSHACKASPSPGSRLGSSGSSAQGPSLIEPGFIKCDGDSHVKSW